MSSKDTSPTTPAQFLQKCRESSCYENIGKSLTILNVLGFDLINPLGISVKLYFTSYVLVIIF